MATIDLGGVDAQRLRGGYKSSLGRDASDDEVTGWMTGRYASGGTVDDWLKQIDTSHEAQQYRARNTAPVRQPASTPVTPPVVGQPSPNTSGPQTTTTTPPPARYTGFTPKHDYSAFNTGREQDPAKSAKDAFAYLSNQAPPPPFHDRAALRGWFNQYILPGMNSLGHQVTSVTDDGFTFSNWQGTFYVDYAQNAGAAPGSMLQRLQWNATSADDATRARYPGGGGVVVPGGGAQGGGGSPQPQPQRQPVSGSFAAPQGSGAMPAFTPVQMPPYQPGSGLMQFDDAQQQQIAQWYWTYLGRMPGMGDLVAHVANPGGLPGIEQAIRDSPEAREYARRPTPPVTPVTPVAPPTPPDTRGGVGGGPLPPNQYSDEYTQLLEELTKARIQMLQGGINDPMRDQYMASMQARANALAGAEPEYLRLIERLESRFKDLQGPGYTGAENEVLRTGALDPIEQDRSAAKQRMLERLAARGLDPNSGIAQQALLEIDNAFDGMRAATQTTLATNDIARREDRAQRADALKGTLYDIPQARAREQLDVFSAMEILENAFRQEQQANSREAIGYGGVLADLGPQRLQLAMMAAGMGGNPASFGNTLLGVGQLNQNAALLNQRNSSNWLNALGYVSGMLTRVGI